MVAILKTDVIEKSNGNAVDLTGQSAAKLVIQYDQSTGCAGYSLNISSITDISTGTYDLKFINSFTDTSYVGIGATESLNVFLKNQAVGGVRQMSDNLSGVVQDATNANVLIHGDLA